MASFKGPSEHCWEEWRITVRQREVKSEDEQRQFLRNLERQVRACLVYIATNAFQFSSHIPQIATESSSGFPFRVIDA